MRDVSFVFFLAAVLCVSGGMIWGLQMAASNDHSMVSAHTHLNLVGWATRTLFAVYYRLTPQAARGWLPRAHAAAILGVATMVPGIAMATTGGSPEPAIVGSLLVLASMLIFLVTMIRHGFGLSRAQSWAQTNNGRIAPAE